MAGYVFASVALLPESDIQHIQLVVSSFQNEQDQYLNTSNTVVPFTVDLQSPPPSFFPERRTVHTEFRHARVSLGPKASHSQVLFAGHSGRVASLAVSPCGRFVATGQEGKSASAIVWDPATGHVSLVFSLLVGRLHARNFCSVSEIQVLKILLPVRPPSFVLREQQRQKTTFRNVVLLTKYPWIPNQHNEPHAP